MPGMLDHRQGQQALALPYGNPARGATILPLLLHLIETLGADEVAMRTAGHRPLPRHLEAHWAHHNSLLLLQHLLVTNLLLLQ